MAGQANNLGPSHYNRPSRYMNANRVVELRKMAAKLLREARRLSGEGPEDTIDGWSPERAATASLRQIRGSSTAWALFERGLNEGRKSNTAEHEPARNWSGPPAQVPTSPSDPRRYQPYSVQDRRFPIQQPPAQQLSQHSQQPNYLQNHFLMYRRRYCH